MTVARGGFGVGLPAIIDNSTELDLLPDLDERSFVYNERKEEWKVFLIQTESYNKLIPLVSLKVIRRIQRMNGTYDILLLDICMEELKTY